jgi:hypothetical protein
MCTKLAKVKTIDFPLENQWFWGGGIIPRFIPSRLEFQNNLSNQMGTPIGFTTGAVLGGTVQLA